MLPRSTRHELHNLNTTFIIYANPIYVLSESRNAVALVSIQRKPSNRDTSKSKIRSDLEMPLLFMQARKAQLVNLRRAMKISTKHGN